MRIRTGVSVLFLAFAACQQARGSDPPADWPQWRGPAGTGVSAEGNPPLEWDERSGQNIRWKATLPGRGHSTPVVWGDRIFLTTAISFGETLKPRYSKAPGAHDNIPVTQRQRFMVIALDRRDGAILWTKTVREALPHEGHHETASFASNSPVTDGKAVYAFFGSFGLFALDFEGNELWHADFKPMMPLHGHGEGSSPALYGETLVVNWDHEGDCFVAAYDTTTGKERWKIKREEVTSWASPTISDFEGKPQVIVSGTNRVRGYDLATGKVLWECGGLSTNVVASPVYADGMVFAGSSYDTRALLAIRLAGAHGNITGTKQVAWTRNKATPYVPSPLLYENSLYFLGHYQGVLTRVNARTGEDQPGAIRLAGMREVYASPVAASGRVYISDRHGATLVLDHRNNLKVLAENHLEDRFNSSAAIAGRDFFLRGEQNLYCLADGK